MRYIFEFISTYQGVSNYRRWHGGKDAGRMSVNEQRVTGLSGDELVAFNDFKGWEHQLAVERYGTEYVGEFVPYT